MWAFLKNLKEFLSLDYRSLFIVACISWIMIVIPVSIWQHLGLSTVLAQARPWIFIIGLSATIWLIAGGLFDLIKAGLEKRNKSVELRKKQEGYEKIIMLTSRVEKEVLARYVAEDTTTIAYEIRDGVVNGLVAKGILYRASQGSNPLSYDFDTNIQTWAWEYLKNHPEILKDIMPSNEGRHQIKF